jgi:NADPH:quinone reductase and related Zn-dependent oxidoreductases
MKAYLLKGTAAANALQLAEIPQPSIQLTEVLIKTHAIDINPVDSKTLQGAGQYNKIKDDPPVIPGWGVSGVVEQTGSAVQDLQPGDEVFGLVNFPGHGRTYAEYVAAPANHLAKKPSNISHETAAAATLAALTAFQALQQAALQPGERVLIQGIAGGVGFPAFQFAKAAGAYVIGTASTKDIKWLEQKGVDEVIDYTNSDFEKASSNIDFVLDTLGGDAVVKAFNILSPRGRLITLPSGRGDAWKAIAAEKGIHATHMFVRSSGDDMQAIATRLKDGSLQPHIAHQYSFEEIPFIHQQMLDKKLSGKIVVQMRP